MSWEWLWSIAVIAGPIALGAALAYALLRRRARRRRTADRPGGR